MKLKKRKPVATPEPIDDLIGTPPSPNQMLPAQSVERGVYLSEHRNSAIVTAVERNKVFALSLSGAGVEHQKYSLDGFLHEYPLALPHYPIRRAARIYLHSHQCKEPKIKHLLRAILAS